MNRKPLLCETIHQQDGLVILKFTDQEDPERNVQYGPLKADVAERWLSACMDEQNNPAVTALIRLRLANLGHTKP